MIEPILLDLPVPIYTKRLLIRPIMPGDGAAMNQAVLESVEQFKEWLPWAQKPPTITESEKTARLFYAEFILRKALHMVIFKDDHLIGMCGYNSFKWDIPSADIGYWCRITAQGQGYMHEAVNALIIYGFQKLGLKRLTIHCDDENLKSAQVAEKAGFELELKALDLNVRPGNERLRLRRRYVRLDVKGVEGIEVTWKE